MSKLDDIIYDVHYDVAGGVNDIKNEIKALIRHDIIKAYSSYPSHYKVEDVLVDQLAAVDRL